MAAHILWVVLDEIAGGDDGIDLGWRNHPAGSAHLAHRVRKVEDPLRRCSPDLVENVYLHRAGTASSDCMPETWAKLHAELLGAAILHAIGVVRRRSENSR